MSTPQRKTFLDLPTELRYQVHENVFDELVESMKHPWDPQPANSRFNQLCSLMLVSHQVGNEAFSLFVQDYSACVILYFTDAEDLVTFRRERITERSTEQSKMSKAFCDARFSLRTVQKVNESAAEKNIRQRNKFFWEGQPNEERPWPLVMSCTVFWGEHARCAASSAACIPYQCYDEWGASDNEIELTTYITRPIPDLGIGEMRNRSFSGKVVHGRVDDLEVYQAGYLDSCCPPYENYDDSEDFAMSHFDADDQEEGNRSVDKRTVHHLYPW